MSQRTNKDKKTVAKPTKGKKRTPTRVGVVADLDKHIQREVMKVLPEDLKKQMREKPRNEKKRKIKAMHATIPGEIVSTKPNTTYEPDTAGIQLFLECFLMSAYKETDLAAFPYPIYHLYYLWLVSFMHIKHVGQLTGELGTALPPYSAGQTYAVPYGLAKYLEYLSPYKRGMSISPALDVPSDYFGTPEIGEVGIGQIQGSNVFPRTSLPNWQAGFLVNDPPDVYKGLALDPPDPTTVQCWGSYIRTFYNLDENPQSGSSAKRLSTFTEWVSTPGAVSSLSDVFQKKFKCIPLGNIPITAPDCSAIAMAAASPLGNPDNFTNGITGPDKHYDPELVPIFHADSDASNTFSSTSLKSLVPPRFIPQGTYYTYPLQIAFAFNWIMNVQSSYKRGKIRNVALIGGKKLSTLYVQPHYLTGNGLSTAAAADYMQLISNKPSLTPDTQIDPVASNFTNFLAICQSALQRKVNLTEVVHLSDPLVTFSPYDQRSQSGTTYLNQINFCDSTWSSVSLPVRVAEFIEAVGVVVTKDGVLRVPQANYAGKVTSIRNATYDGSTLGYNNYSYYGYTGKEDAYYGLPNPYTCSVVNASTTVVDKPTVQLNNADIGPGALLDTDAIDLYYSEVTVSDQTVNIDGFVTAWNTIAPNATAAATMITNFKTFLSYNSTTNTIPMTVPSSNKLGSAGPMTTSAVYSGTTGSVIPLYSPGYVAQPVRPAGEPPNGNPGIVSPSIEGYVSEYPMARDDVLSNHIGPVEDADLINSTYQPRPSRYFTFKHRRDLVYPDPTTTNDLVGVPIGPNSADPPDSNGTYSVYSSLASLFSTPNSTFSSTIERAASKRGATSSPAPPIQFLMKPHRATIAQQCTAGMPRTIDPEDYYGSRVGSVASDVPNVVHHSHKILSMAKGVVDAGKDVVDKIGKGVEGANKLLETPALLSVLG